MDGGRHPWTDRGWRVLRALTAPALLVGGLVLIVAGNAIGGLAMITAGWFARIAARSARRREALDRLVADVTVADVMETDSPEVPPQVTLDALAPRVEAAVGGSVVRIVEDGTLLGIVGPREVARVPAARRPFVRAADAMAPAATLPTLAPGDLLGAAAERLGAAGASGLPVVADGEVTGILTRLGVGRALDERLTSAGRPPSAGPVQDGGA